MMKVKEMPSETPEQTLKQEDAKTEAVPDSEAIASRKRALAIKIANLGGK